MVDEISKNTVDSTPINNNITTPLSFLLGASSYLINATSAPVEKNCMKSREISGNWRKSGKINKNRLESKEIG